MRYRFRAKVIDTVLNRITQLKIGQYTDNNLKDGGVVEGYLCYSEDGKPYILGELLEVTEEYLVNKYWYPVEEESIRLITEK